MDHDFSQARKDFLAHLRYTKGYSKGTCYAYNSDLGIWGHWLSEAGHDWRNCSHVEVEQFVSWLMRERGVKPHIVSRRSSCLASFYKWAMKNSLVENDPMYLADKPKRPQRIPVWLEKEEQERLKAAAHDIEDLPDQDTFHSVSLKPVPRYLAEFEYRFNRRYRLDDMIERLAYVGLPPLSG